MKEPPTAPRPILLPNSKSSREGKRGNKKKKENKRRSAPDRPAGPIAYSEDDVDEDEKESKLKKCFLFFFLGAFGSNLCWLSKANSKANRYSQLERDLGFIFRFNLQS